MAQNTAPNRPSPSDPFVDPRSGRLSDRGLAVIDQIWRQIAAGYPIVPCEASGTNAITLTPILSREGARTYANGMVFSFEAVATTSGLVTLGVGDLDLLKAYVANGATQANTGDIVDGSIYEATYWSSLDSAAGGFVIR